MTAAGVPSSRQPTMLRLADVDAGYGEHRVLRGVSLSVAAGERVGMLGPNGSGKSTLFRVALGILPPWRGTVELFGVPVRRLDRRRFPIGYVPQARQVGTAFPVTAREVVGMGRVGRVGLFRRPGSVDRAAVRRALETVGLAERGDRPFGALSGGEQQRALLARALASEARLFFLDEPATGLDPATQHQLDAVLDDLVADGCAVVVSTHDVTPERLARFDRLVYMDDGTAFEGPPQEVTRSAHWRRLFGAPSERAAPAGGLAAEAGGAAR